jgi:hypothetical protein
MQYDDSDMKIVPDRPSELFDSSEGAANAFVREKNNGNMEKAHQLGIRFAQELTNESSGIPFFGTGKFDNEETLRQRKVLFAYIVHQVIDDIAPNSIVAQSALSAFHETIQESMPEIYKTITDTLTFSLYILSSRSAPDDPRAIGKVFAQLCQRADDPIFVDYGKELAEYFIMHCTQVVLDAQLIR